MRITYRVIDQRTDKDITDDYYWVMRPDGRIFYCDDDLIGIDYAKVVVTVTEADNKVEINI